MSKTTMQLETLTCPSCLQKIENGVKQVQGVESVRVMFNSSKVRVEHSEDTNKQELSDAVEKLGYEVLKVR